MFDAVVAEVVRACVQGDAVAGASERSRGRREPVREPPPGCIGIELVALGAS